MMSATKLASQNARLRGVGTRRTELHEDTAEHDLCTVVCLLKSDGGGRLAASDGLHDERRRIGGQEDDGVCAGISA